jgi:hypothetical protein
VRREWGVPVSGPCPSFRSQRASSRRLLTLVALASFAIAVLAAAPRALAGPPFTVGDPAYATTKYPQCVAIGDVNRDGIADLVIANVGTLSAPGNTVTLRLGAGGGYFGVKRELVTGIEPFSVAIGDLSGDGKPDLAVANAGANTVSVLIGGGNGAFATKVDYVTGSYPYSVAMGDLNGDGASDLVVASYFNLVSVLLGNGNGTFRPKVLYDTGTYPYSVAIADVNRDGKPDLVEANYIDNDVSVLPGAGDGTFGARTSFPTGHAPWSVAVGDLSGDGNPDLAVANSADGTVSILLGNGDGTFGARTDFATGDFPNSVAIGDLDANGTPDLAVASGGGVSLLFGAGDGSFGASFDIATGNTPWSVAIGDLDGDDQADLAVANYYSSTVTVVFNGTSAHPWLGVDPGSVAAAALRVRAWPNPPVDGATISYSLPGRAQASVCVYDLAGRRVAMLARGSMPAGEHAARWDLRDAGGAPVDAGLYLVELRAGAARATARVAVLR